MIIAIYDGENEYRFKGKNNIDVLSDALVAIQNLIKREKGD